MLLQVRTLNCALQRTAKVHSTATGDGAWLLGMPSVLQDASGRIVGSNERAAPRKMKVRTRIARRRSSSPCGALMPRLSGLLELCKGGQPHSCARGGTQGDTVRPEHIETTATQHAPPRHTEHPREGQRPGRHGRGPTEGLATEKAAPVAEGAAQSPRHRPQKDLALLERERQELKDGRLNAAASHAARKGLAQKPRSSRDRAEFDARTLKVEAPRAEQAAGGPRRAVL